MLFYKKSYLIFKNELLVIKKYILVVICFTCYMRKARDLRETRIYIINTALNNKNNHPITNTAYILQYSDTYAC